MKFLALLTLCCILLLTCASYQSSVDSRSVGLTGYSKDCRGGGISANYTVRYR